MKENEYGLKLKTRQYGYVEKDARVDRHAQKSLAGKLFSSDKNILSACVFDHNGVSHLYLKKDPVTLECIMREEL